MDGQDYLNQISKDTRPVQPTKSNGFFSSKFFLLGAIFVIALIAIIVTGSIISANKVDVGSLCSSLKLHLDNTASVIKSYQNEVKSSTLRSSSASLSSIISGTNNKLTAYITEKYSFTPGSVPAELTEQATASKESLESELFQAKINGNLDRIYAHKMAYEISMFTTEETKIYNLTNDNTLKNILAESYESLTTLYDSFNNFSETK